MLDGSLFHGVPNLCCLTVRTCVPAKCEYRGIKSMFCGWLCVSQRSQSGFKSKSSVLSQPSVIMRKVAVEMYVCSHKAQAFSERVSDFACVVASDVHLIRVRVCIQKFPDWVHNSVHAYSNKRSSRSNTKGYGGKTRLTDPENSETTAPSGRELYHLQFLLKAASPETFGYTHTHTGNESCPSALTRHHAMKAYWGSGGISPGILWPRDWMEVSGQLHAPTALPPGK
jgi:hypothetical protein